MATNFKTEVAEKKKAEKSLKDNASIAHKSVTMTADQLEEYSEGIVIRTLVQMGYKASQFQSGRIYRQEMLEVISMRQFEKARMMGRLKCHKDGSRNSKVWAKREDWERFLQDHTNKKA